MNGIGDGIGVGMLLSGPGTLIGCEIADVFI